MWLCLSTDNKLTSLLLLKINLFRFLNSTVIQLLALVALTLTLMKVTSIKLKLRKYSMFHLSNL